MEGMDPSELAAILDKMEKAGRAYKRLEQHIGPGICFGLGTNKSRSHFEKLLPAKEDSANFVSIVENMRSNGDLKKIAEDYGVLRDLVVGFMIIKLQTLQFP